jgi:hypothetical protein
VIFTVLEKPNKIFDFESKVSNSTLWIQNMAGSETVPKNGSLNFLLSKSTFF